MKAGLPASPVQAISGSKSPSSFEDEIDDPDFKKEELKLTRTLIDASILEEFDFASFKDPYVEQLNQIIEAKVEGEEIVAVPDPEEPKVINLMEALKKSVAQARGHARSGHPCFGAGRRRHYAAQGGSDTARCAAAAQGVVAE